MEKISGCLLLISIAVSLFLVTGCGGEEQAASPGPVEAVQTSQESSGEITLVYWRHHYTPEKIAIDKLIAEYEAQNPGVKIVFNTLSYDTYVSKLVASIAAGEGPDIINIHNSWAYQYVKSGLLTPVPPEIMTTADIERDFFPLLSSFKKYDSYYGLAIGASNLALYYNTKLFREAGLDPDRPPQTWEEMMESAAKITRHDEHGRLQVAGAAIGQPQGQAWNYLTDCLIPQNDCGSLDSDENHVLWDSRSGYEAMEYMMGFCKNNYYSYMFLPPYEAFRLGRAGMLIDGSWAISQLKRDTPPDFEYRIAPIPHHKKQVVYGTYWANCVTKKATGRARLEAWKFVKFITSKETMLKWVDWVGELPMRQEAAMDPELRKKYPQLSAFLDQMPYTYASLKKDEGRYKQEIELAIERVLLLHYTPEQSISQAAQEINRMLAAN
ncbi:MAG: ABC transporter substrate-binding protein [Candidatus Wallbacteria bacterium]|nr:ABC transporter substrate-binding protein [Candidatus Wallbacteria bacterium]